MITINLNSEQRARTAAKRAAGRLYHAQKRATDPEYVKRANARSSSSNRKNRETRKLWKDVHRERSNALQRKWRANNAGRSRAYHFKSDYNLTPADMAQMLSAQGGLCAICWRTLGTERKQHVDHCHKTGAVRGLLCAGCNRALGVFGDDPLCAERAAAYLRNGGAK